jgi:hypothetical protein
MVIMDGKKLGNLIRQVTRRHPECWATIEYDELRFYDSTPQDENFKFSGVHLATLSLGAESLAFTQAGEKDD